MKGIVKLTVVGENRLIKPLHRRHRFPPEMISHAVWLYHRFTLNLRDIEDRLAERGVTASYEAIRSWCRKYGPEYARTLRRRQGRLGDIWHVDEVFVKIRGQLSGERWIRMTTSSTSWSHATETGKRPSASFARS